jgi:hypothetical protein
MSIFDDEYDGGPRWGLALTYCEPRIEYRADTREEVLAYLRNDYTYEHLETVAGYTKDQLDGMDNDEFYSKCHQYDVGAILADMTGQSLMDKMIDQARGYVALPGFEALPLEGPGRWVIFPDSTVLYTDDSNILFAKGPSDSDTFDDLVIATSKLFHAGRTATQALEQLRGSLPVTTGDLSELA